MKIRIQNYTKYNIWCDTTFANSWQQIFMKNLPNFFLPVKFKSQESKIKLLLKLHRIHGPSIWGREILWTLLVRCYFGTFVCSLKGKYILGVSDNFLHAWCTLYIGGTRELCWTWGINCLVFNNGTKKRFISSLQQ